MKARYDEPLHDRFLPISRFSTSPTTLVSLIAISIIITMGINKNGI
jgi:hypothetical protein